MVNPSTRDTSRTINSNNTPNRVLKAQLARPLIGIPGSASMPIAKASNDRPDRQSPDMKAPEVVWDDATRKRWSPITELPGFVAIRGDLEFLTNAGVITRIVGGQVAVKVDDLRRAKDLLVTR